MNSGGSVYSPPAVPTRYDSKFRGRYKGRYVIPHDNRQGSGGRQRDPGNTVFHVSKQ